MAVRVFVLAAVACSALLAWEAIGPDCGGPVTAGAISRFRTVTICLAELQGSRVRLHVSTDRGTSWSSADSTPDFLPTSLAFGPQSDSVIIALGLDAHVSRDLGTTWQRLEVPVVGTWRGIAVTHVSPGRVLLAGSVHASGRPRAALACSTESGWRVSGCDAAVPSFGWAVALHPSDTSRIVVGGYSRWPCVYLTSDGGSSWRQVLMPVAAGASEPREVPLDGVHSVYICPVQPDIMIAATRGHGLFRSTNGGSYWVRLGEPDGATALVALTSPTRWVMAVQDSVPYLSTDAGATWRRAGGVVGHGPIGFAAEDPDSNGVAYCVNRRALFRSSNGLSWQMWRSVPYGAVVTALAAGIPPDRVPLYALIAQSRLYRNEWPADSWTECPSPGSGPFSDVAASIAGRVALLERGSPGPACLFASYDSGRSWAVSDSWLDSGGAVAIGAFEAHMAGAGARLDTAGEERFAVVTTTDRGMTWRRTVLAPGRAEAVGFRIGQPQQMVAAGRAGNGALLFVAGDTGRTWVDRSAGLVGPARSALWLANGLLFCGTEQGVYKSADSGLTWAYSGLVDVRELHRDPDGWLLAATGTGLYRSREGLTWYDYSFNLPTLDLAAAASDIAPWRRLYCGTKGMGVFRMDMVGCDEPHARPFGGVGAATIVRGSLVLSREPSSPGLRSPSPSDGEGRGEDAGSRQPVVLLDAAGRKVMELRPGANDVRHLSPGVYFVREGPSAVGHQPSAVQKVVVTK